jgi:hypothetical protein
VPLESPRTSSPPRPDGRRFLRPVPGFGRTMPGRTDRARRPGRTRGNGAKLPPVRVASGRFRRSGAPHERRCPRHQPPTAPACAAVPDRWVRPAYLPPSTETRGVPTGREAVMLEPGPAPEEGSVR